MPCHQKLTGIKFVVISSLGAIATFFFQPLALAETKSLNLKLASNSSQTFTNLMQQAELLAVNSIAQEFKQSSTVTEVAVSIIGERNGQEVPLLFTKVSRSNWLAEPDSHAWTKYFIKAADLLGFNQLPNTKLNVVRQLSIVNTSAKPVPANDPAYRDD